MTNTRELILLTARQLVQQVGFNAFSYADIAERVGIKKASLHHHFPKKVDLGQTLIQDYRGDFQAALGVIDQKKESPLDKLNAYIELYRATLSAKKICLGGMLAAEMQTLDQALLLELHLFFQENRHWLAKVFEQFQAQQKSDALLRLNLPVKEAANLCLSTLQGAMMVSMFDLAVFDITTKHLLGLLFD